MQQLADDIIMLEGRPPYAINVYLLGDVLVNASWRYAARRILGRMKGRKVSLHALTHVHPDHQGSSSAICQTLGIPLWCGEADADAMEQPGEMMRRMPRHWLTDTVGPMWAGPPHPVARRLREGDQVGSFRVIETPGHTVGHISFWREHDRVLAVGDVVCNMDFWKGRTRMLGEPQRIFSLDPALNRQSAKRLAELEPRLVLFGHGPPMRNTRRFVEYLSGLPDS